MSSLAERTGQPSVFTSWRTNLRTVRTIRFAVGTTVAAAIAFAYEWPLYFLTPVLTIVFLSQPIPGFHHNRRNLIAYVIGAVALGMVFTLLLLPYPMAYVPLLGLALFHIYYLLNRRGSFLFALMSLLAVLILPMLAIANEELAVAFGGYFVFGVCLAIVIYRLAHLILPDPPGTPPPPNPVFQPGYSAAAARAALKSTLAVLPLVVVFIALNLQSQVLVVVFAGTLSLIPEVSAGRTSGVNALRSTLLGCVGAIVVYWLLVAVPEFHFFVVLWLAAMFMLAAYIFSDHPLAKYMGSAATAMTILVTGSFAPDADFVDEMLVRLVLIMLATLWVTTALSVLDRYLFKARPAAC